MDNTLDLNRVNIVEEAKESSQFDEIAQTEKKLDEAEDDQVIKTEVKSDNQPENLIQDKSDLFIKDATWEGLGVREELIKGLIEMGFTKPSKIQATTYPLIMKKPYQHLIAQAHNGSGKTGAFGIGTLARIDETQNTIQAVIFAHTRELINQTANVLKKISKYSKIKVEALLNTNKSTDTAHVFVCTPGNFDTVFLKKKLFSMKDLRVIVLDEADLMLSTDNTFDIIDKTFSNILKNKI